MSAEHDVADVLPLRPAGTAQPAANADHARGPARTREKALGIGWWLQLQTVLAGGSLIDVGMPALLVVWARHEQAAKAWKTRWLRWPRWAWGVIHTWAVCPVLRTLEWGTESFPKLAVVLAAIYTTLMWFPHFTITITL
jgi:hypothetical protein